MRSCNQSRLPRSFNQSFNSASTNTHMLLVPCIGLCNSRFGNFDPNAQRWSGMVAIFGLTLHKTQSSSFLSAQFTSHILHVCFALQNNPEEFNSARAFPNKYCYVNDGKTFNAKLTAITMWVRPTGQLTNLKITHAIWITAAQELTAAAELSPYRSQSSSKHLLTPSN